MREKIKTGGKPLINGFNNWANISEGNRESYFAYFEHFLRVVTVTIGSATPIQS